MRNVLVVDDEASIRHLLSVILVDHGYDPRAVATGEEALKELAARDFDLVLTDVRMPGMGGLGLLREIQRTAPELMVIVMSAYGAHDAAIEAMKAGAYDFLSKPFKPDEVVLVLRKAEERERLARENRRLRTELSAGYSPEHMVGTSEPMREVSRQIRKIAQQKTTVLVQGESGTGKELVARAIHQLSPRAALPFVAVNCGAIPSELIESELFGHVKGAFTDAVRAKKGLAAEADGGTLFLDEIGELPLGLQVKLLRFLQEEEVRPVGDTRSRRVDVRVVAATAIDLRAAVAAGRFREDLYWRLDVVGVRLPPLRERREDLPALLDHFLARFRHLRPELPGLALSDEARAALLAHGWPGNVRELEHAVERAVVLADGPVLREEDLPEGIRARARAAPAPADAGDGSLSVKRATRALEERLIRAALERTAGNRTRAAELLELSYGALLYKIKEYGLG
ncbi:sigma-54-dependent transcriptional regulator [Anaeromyxobacter dehalogenans]|uniref:Two component, sigma54 specific, transcriptional regulator, Fis family n=1 Tax=Anaeromyxobacter dehalogenans (strain 2CP-C) TaxID=290397 RepID=Q2INN6_ANADE|nr:sigma-54 dependent transcriptional regulator [Anaeromyxobacter dehalogenans]ABC80415.1 two component, sigma54 specific, transcriptional regulator, Fis family [Anaeromyxobacter dehalogenans 2CP-C]